MTGLPPGPWLALRVGHWRWVPAPTGHEPLPTKGPVLNSRMGTSDPMDVGVPVSADPEHQGGWKHPVTSLRISSGEEGACGLRGHHAGHEGGHLSEPQPQPKARLA